MDTIELLVSKVLVGMINQINAAADSRQIFIEKLISL